MENKMNWGTLILGIVVGAVVVSIVWVASKPAVSGAQPLPPEEPRMVPLPSNVCAILSNLEVANVCTHPVRELLLRSDCLLQPGSCIDIDP